MKYNDKAGREAAVSTIPEARVLIPDDLWEEAWGDQDEMDNQGPPRLFATLRINGVPHHAEAFPVYVDDGGTQATGVYPASFEAYYEAAGGDGPWATVTIKGQEYAVMVTPFCE